MGLTPEVPGTVLQVKPRRGHQQLGQGRHDVRGGRVAGPGEGQELLRQALPVDLFRLPASTAAQMLQLASMPAATTLPVFLQTLGESYQAILSCVPTPKLATCRSGAYVGEPYISKPQTPPNFPNLKPSAPNPQAQASPFLVRFVTREPLVKRALQLCDGPAEAWRRRRS